MELSESLVLGTLRGEERKKEAIGNERILRTDL